MIEEASPGAAALERGLALFVALVEDDGATSLSQLAKTAGMPLSTAHRTLGALLRAGLVSRIGRGRYAAGLRLERLARAGDARSVLRRASRTLLRRLAAELGATVHLGVLEGEMVTYVVKEQSGPLGVLTSELIQLEAYCSGIGKVLLANLDDDALTAYLAAGPFVALTARTITEPAALRLALEQVRAQGHGFDDAELQDGLHCIAAPVYGLNQTVVAALSASSASGPWRDPSHLQALKVCAGRIGARLGG